MVTFNALGGRGFPPDPRSPLQRFNSVWLAPHTGWRAVRAAVLDDITIEIDGQPMFLSDHIPLAVDLGFA